MVGRPESANKEDNSPKSGENKDLKDSAIWYEYGCV